MEFYICICRDGCDLFHWFCKAESRRQAIGKFKEDKESNKDMTRYQWQVGKLSALTPELFGDNGFMRLLRDGKSPSMVSADQSTDTNSPSWWRQTS